MTDQLKAIINEIELKARIKEIAHQITNDYRGQQLKLIGILKGAIFFMVDLAKSITDIPVSFDFMAVSSYGASTQSSGEVRILKDLDEPIEREHILLVEDIIDSGLTIRCILRQLSARNPASLKVCTLLDKPDRREIDVAIDYIGFTLPDRFVVGFGLDFNQKYRNLLYIATLE